MNLMELHANYLAATFLASAAHLTVQVVVDSTVLVVDSAVAVAATRPRPTQAASAVNAEDLLPLLATERSATLATGNAKALFLPQPELHPTLWRGKADSQASRAVAVMQRGVRVEQRAVRVDLAVSFSRLRDGHNTKGSLLQQIRTASGEQRCAQMPLLLHRPQALQTPAHPHPPPPHQLLLLVVHG
jgi:hypothetical protein